MENETLKFEENRNDFHASHMMNYRNACFKGKLFDEINNYTGKMFCFPVREDARIKDGDLVLIDNYCEAYPFNMFEKMDEDTRIFSELVGIAKCTVHMDNRANTEVVFVRNCEELRIKNCADPDNKITDEDICAPCYLDADGTVTRDGLNAFAGQIMSINEDKTVSVFVNLDWRD